MKKFQNVIAVLLVSALLPIAGCSWFGSPKDANPEAVIPQDATLVLAIDHSNIGQVKNLVALWEISADTPIAESTWEVSNEPEVQAEPDDTAIPCISSISRRLSPSMNSNEKLTLFGSLFVLCPLR